MYNINYFSSSSAALAACISVVSFEVGEIDEALEYYDKKLHISVLEISNVTSHMIYYLLDEKSIENVLSNLIG